MLPSAEMRDLRSFVAQYNLFVGQVAKQQRQGEFPELEVRLGDVPREAFTAVLAAIARGDAGATDGGSISQTVVSSMPVDALPRKPGAPMGRIRLLQEQTFSPEGYRLAYRRKEALGTPLKVERPGAPPFKVALSIEKPEEPFGSDQRAVIRVKRRASYVLTDAPWRVDLTVVRTLSGDSLRDGGAMALESTVKKMFTLGGRPLPPADRLLEGLDGGADLAAARLYRYEVEIEHRALPGAILAASEVTEVAERVLRLMGPRLLQAADRLAEIRHVWAFMQPDGGGRPAPSDCSLKKLLPSVVALSAATYASPLYPPTGYTLLDKADGLRALASVHGDRLRLLVGGEMREFPAPPGAAPASETIADGELVGEVLYVFDVVAAGGVKVAGLGYPERAARIGDAVAALRGYGLAVEAKPLVHLTGAEPQALRAQFTSPRLEGRPYLTDGLILVAPDQPYLQTSAYKWKPPEHTTIDFLARRPPKAALGAPPFADAPGCLLHYLFVGVSQELSRALRLEPPPGYQELFPGARKRPYFPAQFAPSDAPLAFLYQHPAGGEWGRDLDGLIVELRCAQGCRAAGGLGLPAWEMVRVRADRACEAQSGKYFGNDFRIAELTWLNYLTPLPKNQLWEGVPGGYFAEKSSLNKAQTAFVSYAKKALCASRLEHFHWVVDLGIGRGADLPRYWDAAVSHVVGVDSDAAALSELVRRKYSYADQGGVKNARRRRSAAAAGPSVSVLRADLRAETGRALEAIQSVPGFPSSGADAVVCNLALHYFADTPAHLKNIVALCHGLLRPGGLVLLTVLRGESVLDLLLERGVPLGGTWEAHQDGALKYAIRRDFAEDRLEAAGQQISVLLPFSGGELRPEYLMNMEFMKREFGERGFALDAETGLAELLPKFDLEERMVARRLTPDDRTWVGLMAVYAFRRAPAA